MSDELEAFLAVHGNITRLADELGITKGAVAQWKDVPIRRVLQVERITGINRSKLRPDFYAQPEDASAS